MKYIFKISIACILSFVLVLCISPFSYAEINGSDQVGMNTVTERSLNITQAPTVECSTGILCSSDGTVLWSRNPNEKHAMASITKIMTALVVLKSGKDLNTSVTISKEAASVGESTSELKTGVQTTIYDLLCGLLVHSGNDAGVALAEATYGTVDEFVAQMNKEAQELGLANTHFANPHGLDADDHYSSSYDLCVLQRYCFNYDTFRDIVGMKTVTVHIGDQDKTFNSTNALMKNWDYCHGTKTGFTNKAGYCLASQASMNDVELYAVVLGCSNEAQRFIDSYKLLDWGFNHYRNVKLASAGDVIVDAPMTGFTNETVQAGVEEDIYGKLLDYDGDISVDITINDVSGGVTKGDEIGVIAYKQGNILVTSTPLIALQSKMGPLAIISIWTQAVRVVGCLTGDKCVAEPQTHVNKISIEQSNNLSGSSMDENLEKAIRADALQAV